VDDVVIVEEQARLEPLPICCHDPGGIQGRAGDTSGRFKRRNVMIPWSLCQKSLAITNLENSFEKIQIPPPQPK
jgi:hypothetical protein